jgi:hypothetical protein
MKGESGFGFVHDARHAHEGTPASAKLLSSPLRSQSPAQAWEVYAMTDS